jgi:hypothetical protein
MALEATQFTSRPIEHADGLTMPCHAVLRCAGIQAQTAECLVVGEIATQTLIVAINKVRACAATCRLSVCLPACLFCVPALSAPVDDFSRV